MLGYTFIACFIHPLLINGPINRHCNQLTIMPVVLFFLKHYSVSVRLKVVGVHTMIDTWESGVLHPLVALCLEKELSIHIEQGAAETQNRFGYS